MNKESDKAKKELIKLNEYLNQIESLNSYNELIDTAKHLLKNHGGEVIPSNIYWSGTGKKMPKEKEIGFVWSNVIDGTEIVSNPIIDIGKCTKQEIENHAKIIIDLNSMIWG